MYSLKIAVNFLPIHAQAFHLMHYSLVMGRQLEEEVRVDEESIWGNFFSKFSSISKWSIISFA